MSHCTSKGENINYFSASTVEYFGTFLNCSSRSVNVIYEEHTFLFQPFRGSNCERTADIGAALAGTELSLRYCRSYTF
jgi:hypothetical protein